MATRSAGPSPSTGCSAPGYGRAGDRLTLAFDNVAAYRSFDRRYPVASRFVDEDFNRLWDEATLDGPRQSIELARARALRPFVDAADLLLDIHSMQYATAPLMLAGTIDRSVALARQVGIPELIMCDVGHAAGKRMRDYGPFGDRASHQDGVVDRGRAALAKPRRRGCDRCYAAVSDRRRRFDA